MSTDNFTVVKTWKINLASSPLNMFWYKCRTILIEYLKIHDILNSVHCTRRNKQNHVLCCTRLLSTGPICSSRCIPWYGLNRRKHFFSIRSNAYLLKYVHCKNKEEQVCLHLLDMVPSAPVSQRSSSDDCYLIQKRTTWKHSYRMGSMIYTSCFPWTSCKKSKNEYNDFSTPKEVKIITLFEFIVMMRENEKTRPV